MQDLTAHVLDTLAKRGFSVHYAETAAEARNLLLSLIPPNTSVGMGGSMTLRELDVAAALQAQGHPVYWHWDAPAEDRPAIYAKARQADIYLASSNAVTKEGEIVNIDGNGNRVAGMFDGPKQVILVISQQKLVDGGLNTAIARIKRHACPPNAKRLGLDTPCAHTGVCNAPQCGEDCMCRVTMVLSHPSRGRRVTVILVEEALGY